MKWSFLRSIHVYLLSVPTYNFKSINPLVGTGESALTDVRIASDSSQSALVRFLSGKTETNVETIVLMPEKRLWSSVARWCHETMHRSDRLWLASDPINWGLLERLLGLEYIQCSGSLQYLNPYAVTWWFPCMHHKMNQHEPTCQITVKALQTRLPCFLEFHHMGWTASNVISIFASHVSSFKKIVPLSPRQISTSVSLLNLNDGILWFPLSWHRCFCPKDNLLLWKYRDEGSVVDWCTS